MKNRRNLILALLIVICGLTIFAIGVFIRLNQQPSDIPVSQDGVCNFIAAGDNFDDGWHDDYLVNMRNYLSIYVPQTDYYGSTVIPGTAQELFDKYEGIFYLSGNVGYLNQDDDKLDGYLDLGGNVFLLTDHEEWNIYANAYLGKYGVSVGGAQPQGAPFVRPAPGLDPKNAGMTRIISSTAGNIFFSSSSLVSSAQCQYYWGEGTVNPTGTDCAWMQLKLVNGGTLNVIASFGALGGGKLGHYYGVITDPDYQQYIISLLDGYARTIAYSLSFNYCTTGGAPLPALCGNGQINELEQCDDGNVISGDGCSSNCQTTTQCNDGIDNDGDGQTDCQAGNEDPGCFPDGAGGGGACSPTDNTETDTTRVCGNSIVETGETCDDGNTTNGDGCSSICLVTTQCNDSVDNDGDGNIDCQDGLEDPGCFPDGNGGGGACSPTDNTEIDTSPTCGNGTVQTGETCDDGNTTNGDGCSSSCQTTTQCNDSVDNDGDGNIDCQSGNEDPGCFPDGAGGGGACTPTDNTETDGPAVCGNSVVNTGETCDDGNTTNGDGCSSTCQTTNACNDGVDNDGDGNVDCQTGNEDPGCFPDGAGGGGSCNPNDGNETDGSVCGNGVLNTGETCDDNNLTNGDGCSSTCQTTTQCNDGVDNDGDGDIDCQSGNEDPGCFPNGNGGGGACTPNDNSESNTPTQCNDGIDNDGDGRTDCQTGNEDPGCFPNGNGGGGACNTADGSETNGSLPSTPVWDDARFLLLGMIFIIAGMIAFRKQIGREFMANFFGQVGDGYQKFTDELTFKVMPYEDQIEKKLSDKAKRNK